MPSDTASSARPRVFDLAPEALAETLRGWGWPAFRAGQVLDWVYAKGVMDPSAMSNLGKADRAALAERFDWGLGAVVRRKDSSDGTIKLLLGWEDGRNAETVLIPDGDRRTACVSSQVGCPVGCRFCASGVNGVSGNLSAGQIVEQVFQLNRILSARNERVGNVVFMGMGEPLANYASVMGAVRILHDPKALNIGARKITISTVGVPARIRQLADEGLAVNLALSLHAPTEELRRELIPWAEHFALEEILEACRHYFERTGREVTLEYILLAGMNDRPAHARQLAKLCRRLRANVNLIRYNEVEGLPYGRPDAASVIAFQKVLRDAHVNAHVRKSRGRDIDAACGQLRRREGQEALRAGGAATLTVGGKAIGRA